MKSKQIRNSMFRAVADITPDIKEEILISCAQQAEITSATPNVWKKILHDREQQEETFQDTSPPKKIVTWTNPMPGMVTMVKKPASQVKQQLDKFSDYIPQMIINARRAIYRLQRRIGKRQLAIVATAAVVVIALIVIIPLNNIGNPVDSVIGIDANPCIEIRTSSSEKVLSVTPLNKDASIVMEDIELGNDSLDEAVSTMIISMLKHGYISEKKNTVLITVENANSKKELSLQEHLADLVSEILNENDLDGALICQTISEEESLRTLAGEHDISIGKAALVKLLTEQNARLSFAEIVQLDINEIGLLLSSWQADLSDVIFIGKANSSAYIGEDKAKSNAIVHAGVLEGALTYVNVRMDHDNGRMVYAVDFRTSNAEFGYEIDAMQGTILLSETDSRELAGQDDSQQHAPPTRADSYISVEEAKTSALFHAELSASNVTFIRTYLNAAEGIYDIEFVSGEYEFDYEIDAYSGVILTYDHDIENYPTPSEPPNNENGYIGREQAKVIALAHAGFSERDVQRLRSEFTINGEYILYKVVFRKDRQQYVYYIDAATGQILRWE